MRTACKCRASPTPAQATQLGRTFGCVLLVWNKTLAERHAAYHQRGEKTPYGQTGRALTGWKKTTDLAFLSEVSSVPLQQTLRHQHTAFQNFFSGRARSPRFKSRSSRQSAHYTRSAFRVRDGRLTLGEFRRRLEYKAARRGRTLAVADRWFPSAKTCAHCGHLLDTLPLGTRFWACPRRRARHDRDVNAAKHILAAGRAAVRARAGDACGAGVRRQGPSLPRSATKQEAAAARQST
ncbi:zinc ribbon domain-containing protein [Nocardiopsis sp. CNT312]|uniref:RNA-guided endonuclease InsQ/TnpB family protein n=1 Tax=Nocardiopsis sp. CNT312 TaxID=1137268 RepID=UPI00048A4FFB|nr:zinc ribbon domain-containing protein [Nocardiopsis sp. CNT312]